MVPTFRPDGRSINFFLQSITIAFLGNRSILYTSTYIYESINYRKSKLIMNICKLQAHLALLSLRCFLTFGCKWFVYIFRVNNSQSAISLYSQEFHFLHSFRLPRLKKKSTMPKKRQTRSCPSQCNLSFCFFFLYTSNRFK